MIQHENRQKIQKTFYEYKYLQNYRFFQYRKKYITNKREYGTDITENQDLTLFFLEFPGNIEQMLPFRREKGFIFQ